MDAAFHERDTHVTAKCNVCFKGVNAAGELGGSTYGDRRRNGIQHAAIGGIANARRKRRKALRGRKGASARGKRRATEPRGQGQTAAAKQNGKHQAPNGRRQATIDRTGRLAANGRRRACATMPRSSESSIAPKQGRRDRKWRNGALLQSQLFKKRRVAHGKEYVLPDKRQHRFHSEVPPREKQAP